MQEFTLFRVSLLREFTVIGIVLIKPVLMAGQKTFADCKYSAFILDGRLLALSPSACESKTVS